jgi:RimJ/RimL family protein N-acetyltransferase
MPHTNPLGQPVGPLLDGWTAPAPLDAITAEGRYCRLEPLAGRHIAPLFTAMAAGADAIWTYLPLGPYAGPEAMMTILDIAASRGWKAHAVIDTASGAVLGTLSFMRIDAANGSVEIGAVIFSPRLQKSRIGTEAVHLMMRHLFQAGYRRCEWKCDALNAASCRAALRYGFSPEGVFRQAVVVRGRNRDTAWFACTDGDWPAMQAAFETWLAPENFDAEGRQKQRLSALTRPLLHWPEGPIGI